MRELQTSEADKEVAIHRLEAKLALASIEARQNARREQERIEVRLQCLQISLLPAGASKLTPLSRPDADQQRCWSAAMFADHLPRANRGGMLAVSSC